MCFQRTTGESAPFMEPLGTARLDAKGVLKVEPGGKEKEAEWIGDTSGEGIVIIEDVAKQATHFDAVCIGDENVSVGDSIYLTPERIDEPCEIAMVSGMFETEDSEKILSVRWFWRPEHIQMPSAMLYDDKEIFLSDPVDHVPVEDFECKCTVQQLRESDAVGEDLRAPGVFFYRRMYDATRQEFRIAKGSEPRAAVSAQPPPVASPAPEQPAALSPAPEPPPASALAPAPAVHHDAEAPPSLDEPVSMDDEVIPAELAEGDEALGASLASVVTAVAVAPPTNVPAEEPAKASTATAPKSKASGGKAGGGKSAAKSPAATAASAAERADAGDAPSEAPAPAQRAQSSGRKRKAPEAAPSAAANRERRSSGGNAGKDAAPSAAASRERRSSGGNAGEGGLAAAAKINKLKSQMEKAKKDAKEVHANLTSLGRERLCDVLGKVGSIRDKQHQLLRLLEGLEKQVLVALKPAQEDESEDDEPGVDAPAETDEDDEDDEDA